MTTTLPDWTPHTEDVPASWAGTGRFSYGTMRHPIVKAPDGRLAVDIWVRDPFGARQVWAKVWRRSDHPNLALLPDNAPRAVKALYRADGQLAEMRAETTDCPSFKAMAAWDHYLEAKR